MSTIVADTKKIAACGLYCGACRRHLAGKCPGCAGNEQAWWCKIRSCAAEKGIATCAECQEHPDLTRCKRLNNLPGKLISLLLNSNRFACLEAIRAEGLEAFAERMAREGRQSLPRR